MEKQDYSIECGKRSIDDSKKISIPGELILCPSSRKLLLCIGGFIGNYRDYLPYFAEKLGEDFNVYFSELRNRGFTNVDNCGRDLVQIDQHLRKKLGIEDVVYVGHSMGMNAIAASRKINDSRVNGVYGISVCPSIGDSRTRSDDLNEKGLQQTVLDLISGFNYGPLGSPLKEHVFEEQVRFALAGNDEVLNLKNNTTVLKRFLKYFDRNPKSSTRVFEGMNHCFNYKPWDLKPFNKDSSDLLIEDIKYFAEGI